MAEQAEGRLSVASASGQQFDVNVAENDTALTLKARLRDQMVEAGLVNVPVCSAMKLVHGLCILPDDCVLKDYGITDGEHLMLVFSFFPSGIYSFASRRDNAPAGDNTTARVQASFQDDTFTINIRETEITSLMRFPGHDSYWAGERWDHEYTGTTTGGEGQQIILKVLDCQRRGMSFQYDPHADLMGEIQESADHIRLQLPFEAGWCNEGKAGLKWISLSKSCKEMTDASDSPSIASSPTSDVEDPFAPPEQAVYARKQSLFRKFMHVLGCASFRT